MTIINYFFDNKNKKIMRSDYYDISHYILSQKFFNHFSIDDNLHSRLDIMLLICSIHIFKLETSSQKGKVQARLFLEEMIFQFKLTLRELHISETKIGKKLKPMISAFYGRYKAYKKIFLKIDCNITTQNNNETIKTSILQLQKINMNKNSSTDNISDIDDTVALSLFNQFCLHIFRNVYLLPNSDKLYKSTIKLALYCLQMLKNNDYKSRQHNKIQFPELNLMN